MLSWFITVQPESFSTQKKNTWNGGETLFTQKRLVHFLNNNKEIENK